MKKIIERLLIKLAKYLNIDLLAHAHVQIGAGHNTYISGEDHVIEQVLVKILNKEPEVIFDVGANIGTYAKQLVHRFKSAKVYCFEPIPDNFNALVQNTAGLNTVNISSAVGSQVGQIKLYLGSSDHDGSMATSYQDTLANIFQFAGEVDRVVECEVITLDDFCGDQITKIDFLKIDVEGHELQVLKGADNLISQNRISVIQFEFNEFNIFSKSFMYDFYQLLKDYDFYRITPQNRLYPMGTYHSSLEIFRYQNILAIHRSLNYVNS